MSEQHSVIIPLEFKICQNQAQPSPTQDLVEIPRERKHDSGTSASFSGILISFFVAIAGCAALGFGYGAIIALCGKKFVNIGLALSFPFWMNVPSQLGFMLGHMRIPKWRKRISLLGFITCYYALCIGWLFSVLDGPGLVLNPINLFNFLTDASVYGLWIVDMGLVQDIIPLTPYLLTLRACELLWIFQGGLFSGGAETPYPYCQQCKCWMNDEAKIRLRYQPSSNEEVQKLAVDLVSSRYDTLFDLNQPVEPKQKGLELSAYSCEKCNERHVLNAIWYRSTPDPEKSEVEQMLESGTGMKLVTGLIIPKEVQSHIASMTIEQAKRTDEAA
jgi:hypothetical protein